MPRYYTRNMSDFEENRKKSMKKRKKWLSVLMAGVIGVASTWCCSVIPSKADAYWPNSISVESGAAIVLEQETGTVLYEKNADESFYPASITKIMTALLAVENCSLDEEVTFSEEAVYKNEGDTSHISRDVNEVMTMEQCLYGMMLESANECAWAIGEHVAGDMDAFVKMMNDKATSLGCTHTNFKNPNGLPDDEHYVSARDMALIARAAYENPTFREICGTRSYNIGITNKHKEITPCNNSHAMISNHKTSEYLYDYALGGKTGFTDDAGNTLVTYAKKDGLTLVCVILNGHAPSHYTDTIHLFDYCFANFATFKVAEHATIAGLGEKNAGLLSDKIDLIRFDEDAVVVLPKTASFEDAVPSVSPAPEGSKGVAEITYTYADRVVGKAGLLYETEEKMSYPFHNVAKDDGGSDMKYFRIDFKTFLMILFVVAIVALIAFIIHLESGNILLRRHRKNETKALQAKRHQRAKNGPQSIQRSRGAYRSYNTKKSMSGNDRSGQLISRKRKRRRSHRRR